MGMSVKAIGSLAGLFLVTHVVASHTFPDVTTYHPYHNAVGYVYDQGIVGGYPDGTFKPDQLINRAEFTKIIIGSVFGANVSNPCTKYGRTPFTDVRVGEWYTPYVCTAVLKRVIDGYPDQTFRPSQPINFAEATKIIVAANGFPVGEAGGDPWYIPYYEVLADKGADPSSIRTFDQLITRGEMAEMIYLLDGGTPSSGSPSLPPPDTTPSTPLSGTITPPPNGTHVLTKDFFGLAPVGAKGSLLTSLFNAIDELGVGVAGVNGVTWRSIEPSAPVNGKHTYNWNQYDGLAREADRIGVQLQFTLQIQSSWGTESLTDTGQHGRTAPVKPEHMDDYRTFIREMVQRYNGNSSERLPGLSGPVLSTILIGNEIEVPNHYTDWVPSHRDTVDDYYDMLEAAYEEAKAVDPSIIVSRGSSNFGDAFDDCPSDATAWSRISSRNPNFSKLVPPGLDRIVPFDTFSLHPNYGTLGTYCQGMYMSRQMKNARYIAEDTRSVLVNSPNYGTTHWPDSDGDGAADILETIDAGPSDPGYSKAKADYERAQSQTTVKKMVLGAASGYESLIIVRVRGYTSRNPKSSEWWFAGLFELSSSAITEKKPAFYGYKALIAEINGAEVLGYASPAANVHLVKFRKNGRDLLIAWHEGADTTVNLSDFLGSASSIERFPAEQGERSMVPLGGSIEAVELTKTPVLISE